MTKETKVGLLVGLAFIILFAIILSEKGATNNVTAPSNLTVADAGQGGGSLIPRSTTPLAEDGKLPIEKTLPPATDIRTVTTTGHSVIPERPVGVPIPKSQEEVTPLSPSIVEALNGAPMAEREVRLADVGGSSANGGVFSNSVARAIGGDRRTEPPLVIHSDPEERISHHETEDVTPPAPPVKLEPVRIIANHKVNSGESLGKIAARYYGRSTPARINAIFDVNRDKLASVHAVRVGDVLRIPAIPDADGVAFERAADFTPARINETQPRRDEEIRIPISIDNKLAADSGQDSRREPEAAPIEFKWYEVRENDTLSKIAKRQMGNDRLYIELFEFNRDLLPNKNSIKPGMKIRIPMVRAGAQISSADFTRSRRDGGQHQN
ncbi:MAG TPA: LysM peptidoglycan-binding domain-containing protein [Phycisphaerae bacterium]|nr:LysM peptidoglycan-binding domain-containing protein [Phycisphaerae bacterium]